MATAFRIYCRKIGISSVTMGARVVSWVMAGDGVEVGGKGAVGKTSVAVGWAVGVVQAASNRKQTIPITAIRCFILCSFPGQRNSDRLATRFQVHYTRRQYTESTTIFLITV